MSCCDWLREYLILSNHHTHWSIFISTQPICTCAAAPTQTKIAGAPKTYHLSCTCTVQIEPTIFVLILFVVKNTYKWSGCDRHCLIMPITWGYNNPDFIRQFGNDWQDELLLFLITKHILLLCGFIQILLQNLIIQLIISLVELLNESIKGSKWWEPLSHLALFGTILYFQQEANH